MNPVQRILVVTVLLCFSDGAPAINPRIQNAPAAPATQPEPAVDTPAPQPEAEVREFNEEPEQPAGLADPTDPQQSAPIREFSEDEPQASPPTVQQPSATSPSSSSAAGTAQSPSTVLTAKEEEMRGIAERFAPIIYHRLAGTPEDHRFDFPTVFNFDGDWIGNNNWENAADSSYKLWSYLYYSVLESEQHYFIHYAAFHPRDWSTVQQSYTNVLDVLQERYKDMIGSKERSEIEFNHENDLEGLLVIVAKRDGDPQPVAMETVAHNHLLRYVAPSANQLRITSGSERQLLRTENGRPLIYIESQKHGIQGYHGQSSTVEEPLMLLRFGKAMEVSQVKDLTATYDLVSIQKTFWKHARDAREPGLTFGGLADFGERFCEVPGATRPACVIGSIGGAIRGDYARPNSASAPWNWIDVDDPTLPHGAWFFDPILILKRHFGQFDLQDRYVYHPYLGIGTDPPATQGTAK